MTKRNDIKGVSIVVSNKVDYKNYGELNIVYENNLILEELSFFIYYDNFVKVTH